VQELVCYLGARQQALRIQPAKHLHKLGDKPRPTCLVAGAEAGSVIPMKIFVEQDAVLPMGILLELACASVNRTAAMLVPQEDPRQAVRNLASDLEQVHLVARSSRALDSEIITVIEVEAEQGGDQ